MPTRRGLGDEGEYDLVLNLKTAKRLGLSFPLSLLGRAEALLQVLTNNTYRFKRIGLEAGPLSQWLYSVLAEAGLPVICVENGTCGRC